MPLSIDDLEAAIAFTERNKWTHECWVKYLEAGGVLPDDKVGDLGHHQGCVDGYEHVLTVLEEVAVSWPIS